LVALLTIFDWLNVSIFFIFLAVSVVPFYAAKKLGKTSLGLVSLALGVFAILHGSFHALITLGPMATYYGLVIVGPASAVCLMIFATYFFVRGG
jgi:hypothetical protein